MPTPAEFSPAPPPRPGVVASAYFLRTLCPDEFARVEGRLVYDISGDPATAALVVCDHSPGLTVGRHGSASHVHLTPAELAARGWPVRWVARGGGVHLHTPGQVACHPVASLAALGLTPAGYVAALAGALEDLARSFRLVPDCRDPLSPTVTVRGRAFAQLGAAVRHGVAAGGVVVNVAADLELFRDVECDGLPRPMTSLQRECVGPVRSAAVRQRLVTLLAERLGFSRVSVSTDSPFPALRTVSHAIQPARP